MDLDKKYNSNINEPIYEEDSQHEKENLEDNISAEKKTLHEQVIDYFSRFQEDNEKSFSKGGEHKASSLSLHPSKLPKSRRATYSPVTAGVSGIKSKTTAKAGYDELAFSQQRTNMPLGAQFPKNLMPINLNPSLSRCDEFTYKSPNVYDFNEFKTEDHLDMAEGTLYDYLSGCNSPESLPLNERLKKYETQFERS